MVKRIVCLFILAAMLGACSYSIYTNAYPHLKKIQVMAFENKTSEFNLGDKVLNNLANSFRDDGRLKVVANDPDCQLDGVITSYSDKVFSYTDANQVKDYQVNITFSIVLTDLRNNQVIYENKSLSISEMYYVDENSTARFGTKEEAIDEIIKNLYRTIIQNSLENW